MPCVEVVPACTLAHVDPIRSSTPPGPGRPRGFLLLRRYRYRPLHGAPYGHLRMLGTPVRPSVRIMSELPQYVYVEVADRVEAEIRSGRLPVGARLPNERAMGEQYGVAPGTARRAVQELRERGLVATLPNKGTYIIESPAPR